MGNPKNISSYDPQLVLLIQTLADVRQPAKVPYDFESPSQAITFASRFSTLRRLLEQQAIRNGNNELASRIKATRLRRKDAAAGKNGRMQTTAWWLCNPEEANQSPESDQHRRNLDLIYQQLPTVERKPVTPPPNPMDEAPIVEPSEPDPSDYISNIYGTEDNEDD